MVPAWEVPKKKVDVVLIRVRGLAIRQRYRDMIPVVPFNPEPKVYEKPGEWRIGPNAEMRTSTLVNHLREKGYVRADAHVCYVPNHDHPERPAVPTIFSAFRIGGPEWVPVDPRAAKAVNGWLDRLVRSTWKSAGVCRNIPDNGESMLTINLTNSVELNAETEHFPVFHLDKHIWIPDLRLAPSQTTNSTQP